MSKSMAEQFAEQNSIKLESLPAAGSMADQFLSSVKKKDAGAGSSPLESPSTSPSTSDQGTGQYVKPNVEPSADQILSKFQQAYDHIGKWAEDNVFVSPSTLKPFQLAQKDPNAPAVTDATARAKPMELVNQQNQEAYNDPKYAQYVQQQKDLVKKNILEGDGSQLRFFVRDQMNNTQKKIADLTDQANQVAARTLTSTPVVGGGGATIGTGTEGAVQSQRPYTKEELDQLSSIHDQMKDANDKLVNFQDAANLIATQQAYQQVKKDAGGVIYDPKTFVQELDKTHREILGDKTVISEQAMLRSGRKLRPDEIGRNSENGLAVWSNALAVERARYSKLPDDQKDGDAKNQMDAEAQQLLDASRKQIVDNPEYYRQQLGRLVANEVVQNRSTWGEVFNTKPDLETTRKIAHDIGVKYGLTEQEATVLSSQLENSDLPMTSAVSQFMHGLSRGTVGLSNFVRRMAMTVGGTDQNAIDYINNEAMAEFERDFQRADVKQAFAPQTIVGQRLQNVNNPDSGKMQLNVGNVTAIAADTFGQILDAAYSGKFWGTQMERLGLLSQGAEAAQEATAANNAAINNTAAMSEIDRAAMGIADKMAPASRTAEQAEKVRDHVGLFAQTYASTFDDNLRDARQAGGDMSKAMLYAVFKSAATAGTEMIFPETDWVPKIFNKISPNEFLSELASKGLSQMVTKEGMKNFITRVGKDVTKEVSEELLDNVAEWGLSAMLIPQNLQGRNFWQEQAQTAVQTAIGTMLPMTMSHLRNRGPAYKDMLYHVGQNPETYLTQLDNQVTAGTMTNEEADRRKQVINTAKKAVELSTYANTQNKQQYVFDYLRNALTQRDKQQVADDPALVAQIDQQLTTDIAEAQRNEAEIQARRDQQATPDHINEQPESQPIEQKLTGITADQLLEHITRFGETVGNDVHYDSEPGSAGAVTPAPVSLAAQILSSYNITENQVEPKRSYTVHVPTALGSLASFVGAAVQPVGNKNVKVTLNGDQLTHLINQEKLNQNATLQSTGKIQESGAQSSQQEHSSTLPGQQNQTQGQEAIGQTNDSNSIQRGGQGQEAQTQIATRPFVSLPQTERVVQTNRGVTTISPIQPVAQPQAQASGNISVQLPRVQINERGELQLIDNETAQHIAQPQNEVQLPTVQQPRTTNNTVTAAGQPSIEGVYQFSQAQEAPINNLYESQSFRQGRPFVEATRRFVQTANRNPALVFQNEDGRMIVLDGRARIAAAKARGETTFPVRFLNGTADQARQVGDLARELPTRHVARLRADNVLSRAPQSFEEHVLQSMLGSLRSGEPMISLNDFKRYVAMNVTNNPYRLSYGKTNKDYNQLIRTHIIGPGGANFDEFVMDYQSAARNENQSQQDLINQAVDIIVNNQDKEGIINRLEQVQGVPSIGLTSSMMPLKMTEQEAVFVSEHGLNNVMEDILYNADQVNLTEDEANILQKAVRDNADPGTQQIDIQGVYNDIFNNETPEAQTLAEKITDYAINTEKSSTQLVGDSGSEAVLGNEKVTENTAEPSAWDNDDLPFSRTTAAGFGRLTADNAKRVGRALGRAFKGLDIVVDRKQFAEAFGRAIRRSNLPLEAEGYMRDMQRAQDTLAAAQRAFDNKRRELDATTKADQVDLFGNRQANQAGAMFDQRIDPNAREAAIKPFVDRLRTAQKTVNTLQKKIDDILNKGGTIQGAIFSRDSGSDIAGFVLDGKVYFNPDVVRADTPIHEIGGHILTAWAETNYPQLHEKIMSAAENAPDEVKNYVRQYYKEVDENSNNFREEVFATAMGWNQANLQRTQSLVNMSGGQKIIQSIRDVWNDFVNFLIDKGVIKSDRVMIGFDPKEFESMSLSDFTNMVGEKMFAGRRLSAPKDLPNIRAMGADFSMLKQSDFVYDYYGNIVDVRPEVKQAIAIEKDSIKKMAIADGSYMRTAAGTLSNLTEDQWLTTRTRRFLEWAKNKDFQPVFDAINKTEVKGTMGEVIKEWIADPLKQQQVMQLLVDQARTESEAGGLMDTIGMKAFKEVVAFNESPTQVMLDSNGEPQVFFLYGESGDGKPVFIRNKGINEADIKSANSNTTFSNQSNDPVFQRIGENANLTPHQVNNLQKAKEMDNAKLAADKIFFSTGWFRGVGDNQWRYELPNHGVEFMEQRQIAKKNLSDILLYPALYEAYPQLADMKVNIASPAIFPYQGAYLTDLREIMINGQQTAFDQYLTIRHEAQHAIQHIEGFEPGANIRMGQDYYDRKVLWNQARKLGFQQQLDRLARIGNPDEHADQIRYLLRTVNNINDELQDLQSRKDYWISKFYYRYAGEQEARGVERRGQITDEMRTSLFPDLGQKEVLITFADNQQLKPLYPRESPQFTPTGQYIGDTVVQSFNNLQARFSRVPSDANETFTRGLNMWQSVLELSRQFQDMGHDKRLLMTSKEFLDLFGAKSYQQLPSDIRAITETIWNMNPVQQDHLHQAVTEAINSKAENKKSVFTRALNNVKEPIAQAQPLREKKSTSISADRPETAQPKSSMLRDIANGLDDNEIVEQRRNELGGTLDQAAENRLRKTIVDERANYESFQADVDAQVKKLYQGGEAGRIVKQFHIRMLQDGRFVDTPAFKRLSEEVRTYERTSKANATERARDIVALGKEAALDQLRIEASGNSAFVPVLAGALLEELRNRKDTVAQSEVLNIMYAYTHQAGLNLNMVGAFYHMLGMSDAVGKINFFTRVKNQMLKSFYEKLKVTAQTSQAFNEVKDVQAKVFQDMANATPDSQFRQRIEKLIEKLKEC